ncbi:MAG: bifunctional 4-hydroxy-2-oxoglutarate aldolase/2-dehydro-3-deoxy-phosphogluconate aldolase [Sporolactobacillus sp.]
MDALASIKKYKIISIIRGLDKNTVLEAVKALIEGGVKNIEVTLNSPSALKSIEKIREQYEGQVAIGAGTVLDATTAREAILAGADFILAPSVNLATIEMAKKYGKVSIPGALSATEILTAFEHGADIVKVFPAMSPSYIKDIRGPLPQIPLLPTGGVSIDNAPEFLKVGAFGLGIGSAIVNSKEKMNSQTYDQIVKRAQSFMGLIERKED